MNLHDIKYCVFIPNFNTFLFYKVHHYFFRISSDQAHLGVMGPQLALCKATLGYAGTL